MITLINTTTWENRELVLFQPVLKVYPHMPFLDNHSSCIIGKSEETMETVYKTDGQNTTTIELFPMETFSSNSPVLNNRNRIQQFK